MVNVLGSVRSLSGALPKDTMQHRINLLARQHVSEAHLKQLAEATDVPRFVDLVSKVNDRLLPRYSESNRLHRAVLGIYRVFIPFCVHGQFLERCLNFLSVLRLFLPSRVQDGSAALVPSVLLRHVKTHCETDVNEMAGNDSPNRRNVLRRGVSVLKRYKARMATMKANTSDSESYLAERMKQSALPTFNCIPEDSLTKVYNNLDQNPIV